jgi:hypothetical protein
LLISPDYFLEIFNGQLGLGGTFALHLLRVLFDLSRRTCGRRNLCCGLLSSDEAIEVELAFEGGLAGSAKVPWHDVLSKNVWLVDGKGTPIGGKRQDVLLVIFLRLFEHSVELLREWLADASILRLHIVITVALLGGRIFFFTV